MGPQCDPSPYLNAQAQLTECFCLQAKPLHFHSATLVFATEGGDCLKTSLGALWQEGTGGRYYGKGTAGRLESAVRPVLDKVLR